MVETSSLNILDVQTGSRVTLTHNANVYLGLYNGSVGTVVSIVFPERGVSQGVHLLPTILVVFDNYVGPAYCKPKHGEVWSSDDDRRRLVPVSPIMAPSPTTPRVHEQYIPLIPATPSTLHRAQGTSMYK